MTIHLIHHADVIRPIKTTLRSFGVPKQDLEDGIARNWRLNEKEKQQTEQKYCTGLCEEPDDVDARRMVAVLQEMFDGDEMPQLGDEILDCVQAGMNHQKTAVELGLSPETVRKRLTRMRDLFGRRLATLGLTVTMLMLVLLASGPAMAANLVGPASPESHVPVPPPRFAA
jgi:sugar diacid utilization regulator